MFATMCNHTFRPFSMCATICNWTFGSFCMCATMCSKQAFLHAQPQRHGCQCSFRNTLRVVGSDRMVYKPRKTSSHVKGTAEDP